MGEFPPKFSKVLLTPDPQYMPGYAGYCPQLKYHHGITYGKLTAKLLSSPEVSRSRRYVLHTGRFPSTEADTRPRDQMWRSRCGETRYFERMIPGYTGFVPKRRNYFSRTYAETCREALCDFEDQQRRMRMSALSGQTSEKHASLKPKSCEPYVRMTPISKECTSYKPPDPYKPYESPYFMEDGNPQKYFISGFTGYLPKSHFFIGKCYPIISNKALSQFSREMKGDASSAQDPANNTDSLPTIATNYHPQGRLLPSYTGHVPGYKFKYGQTFGRLTHNALGLSDVQKKLETK